VCFRRPALDETGAIFADRGSVFTGAASAMVTLSSQVVAAQVENHSKIARMKAVYHVVVSSA
jgi:hypothetical protein